MLLSGALPLGMMAELSLENYSFTLHPGDMLTFVSDGVIEAANSTSRELFGFERTRSISRLPATEIVQQANAFGQNDDITVMTITRLAEAAA